MIAVCILCMALGICCGCANRETEEPLEAKSDEAADDSSETAYTESPLLLKVATTKTLESTAYEGLEILKESIETDSGGSIEVQIYPSGRLGEQTAIMEGVRLGTIEVAFLPLGAAENIEPEVAELAPLFSAEEDALALTQTERAEEIFTEMQEGNNIRCLDCSLGGIQNLWTKQQIQDIGQLQGLRIRVAEIPSYITAFQNLDVSISSLPLSQVYDGLKTNLLDGMELDSESVLCYSLYETCKYCLETEHAVSVNAFFLSEDVWQEISPEQQEIVQAAVEDVSEWLTEQYQEKQESIRSQLEEKGVVFYQPEGLLEQEIQSRMLGGE